MMEEDVKAALIGSGFSRTQEQQDCCAPRDVFWATLAEEKFNDKDYKPDVDLRGVVDGAHAEKCPMQRWQGAQLKKQYTEIRPHFTMAHKNWSKSGQM